MEWYRSYVFLFVLCTRDIVDMVDLSDFVKRPHDPRMCNQLCKSITGCRGHSLNSSSMTCQLISQLCATPMTEKDTAKENKTGNLSCNKLSPLVQSRKNNLKSVKELANDENTGILLVQKGKRNCYFHHLNITTKSLHPLRYNAVNAKGVYTLAYISKINLVLVCRRFRLDACHLYSGVRRFYKWITVEAMSVDEKAGLVFLIVLRHKYSVCTMSTRGQHLRNIVRIDYFSDITVDFECRIVYISGPSGLVSFNYDGGSFQVIMGGMNIKALTLDVHENIIYFASGQSLYKLSDASKPELIKSFGIYPVMLTYDDEQIYIIYLKDITVTVFNVKSRKFVDIVTPSGKEFPYTMCLLR